ncbi:hypothetical protein B0T21DRAFT_348861 [Apiosordaria backusii]|uniref:Uncharacterized protein n=1 Tax=Apiosordaria backusii TaxID=314023 RepID=A0AA40BJG3_9PEZI|nr:hypothetical protein B0T21DRAFT_348861 [Apiosordaria backusii]
MLEACCGQSLRDGAGSSGKRRRALRFSQAAKSSVLVLSAISLDDLVHRRQMLAAARNPFPAVENPSKKSVLACEKRQEPRLLPQDDGYIGWREAKRVFFEKIRQFLCRPEIKGLAVIEQESNCDGEVHEEDVAAFLEEYFPLMMHL